MLMSTFLSALVLASMPGSVPSLPSAPAPPPGIMLIGAEESTSVCPVCGNVIPFGKGRKVVVRSREYTVDDSACGEALAANPDKYLDPDGTPKNTKKKEESP